MTRPPLSNPFLCFLLFSFTFSSCVSDRKEFSTPSSTVPRFKLLSSQETNVSFQNILIENAQINYFENPYIYNGGGVAVGDVNNDGLPDIYFISNIFSNKLYLNKGNLVFEDISVKAGIEASRGFKTGVAMVDLNNDGWLDIYVCRSHHPDPKVRADFVYINNKDLTFTEKALDLGINDQAYTTHVAFLDYDNDGDLDIYQINHPNDFDQGIRVRLKLDANQNLVRRLDPESMDHSDHLYRNKGNGTFEDVTGKAGVVNSAFGLSASLIDVNNDNYVDVYVANDFIEPDMLYINNKDGTFTDKIYQYFRHTAQNSMGSDLADFNNDGMDDLISLDMLAESNERQKRMTTSMVLDRYETLLQYGYGHQLMRNSLQLNNGNGSFSEIGLLAGVAATDWSWSSVFADFDNDGFKDIFISNGIRRDMTDSEYIQFKRDTIAMVQKTGDPYVTPKTMQKWLDRMPSVKVHNYMFRNTGGLVFEDVSTPWGFDLKTFSNGTVYSDLDLDGDLDLVVNELDSIALIYRNESDKLPNHHYLQFAFKGSSKNPFGIGTKVTVYTKGRLQYHELKVSRGFLSSVEPVLHFGLGTATMADSVIVRWPDGKVQKMENVKSNQRINVLYEQAKKINPIETEKSIPLLIAKYPEGTSHRHEENRFNDFEVERLLPHMFSKSGPGISVADINADGYQDFFIGGAKGQPASVFIQNAKGAFTSTKQPFLEADSSYEDVAALFIDVDQDRDMDLIVVSGGYEFGEKSAGYQPRLYLNNGQGSFTKHSLSSMEYNGSCIKAADMDLDGDLDIFIGSNVVPGSYGQNPRSHLLQNDNGNFSEVTDKFNSTLAGIGMVTDALWTDVNGDRYPDLIVVGEWMPIMVFENKKGQSFENTTSQWGLEKSAGWWNCVVAFDADGDGDMDLATGNMGWNSLLKASATEPMDLFSSDFDANGSDEAIICSYMGGTSWPLPRKEVIVQQIPSLKKKFVSFEKYSKATIEDVFDRDQLNKALHKQVFTLTSSVWINQNGIFSSVSLPIEAQVSPVNTIHAMDLNNDGIQDLILAGNKFGIQVELGRYDAGHGLVLLGMKSPGMYEPLSIAKSGLYVPGEVRDIDLIKINGRQYIIFANNNGPIQFFEIQE
jgi:enediyne biosynthesis protein E4